MTEVGKRVTLFEPGGSGNIADHNEVPSMPNISTFFYLSSRLVKKNWKPSLGKVWKDPTHMFSITSLWPTLSVWYFLHQPFPPPIASLLQDISWILPSATSLSVNPFNYRRLELDSKIMVLLSIKMRIKHCCTCSLLGSVRQLLVCRKIKTKPARLKPK